MEARKDLYALAVRSNGDKHDDSQDMWGLSGERNKVLKICALYDSAIYCTILYYNAVSYHAAAVRNAREDSKIPEVLTRTLTRRSETLSSKMLRPYLDDQLTK